jgi:hypothetical protein
MRSMRSAVVAWLALAAVAMPASARAEDDTPDSRIVIEDRGPNRLLLATGIATLGFNYAVSAWVGVTSPRESERFLTVPLFGPWLALARREGCGGEGAVTCENETTYVGLLIADGALQALGAAQIGFAFVKREKRELERPAIVPLRLDHGAGVAAVGTF